MRTPLSLAPLVLALAALPASAQQGLRQSPTGGRPVVTRQAGAGVQREFRNSVTPPAAGGGFTGGGFGSGYTPSYGGFGRTPSYGGFGEANLHRGRFAGGTTFYSSGFGGFGFGGPGFGYGGLGYGGFGYGGIGYGGLGYGGLGLGYGLPYYGGGVPPLVVSLPPVVNYVTPEVYQPLGPDGFPVGGGFAPGVGPGVDPLLAEEAREADRRWNGPVDAGDPAPPEQVLPSGPRAVAEALEAERRGDEQFRRVEFGKAYGEYRRAVAVAPDRGPARFRKGYALAALGEFERAVREFRRGLELDPSLPTTGPTLVELFGEGNNIPRVSFIGKIARFAREDVRDPTRLFLLGVVMHAAGDPRAAEVFEATWRLGGDSAGTAAYLNPVEVIDGESIDLEPPPLPAPAGEAAVGPPADAAAPAAPLPNVAPTDIAPTDTGGGNDGNDASPADPAFPGESPEA